jgi:hypothetical protein
MSDYFAATHTFSATYTAEKVVNAVDFDRHVYTYASLPPHGEVTLGFTATTCLFAVSAAYPSSFPSALGFVLPANEEIWASSPDPGTISVLVTGVR